MKDRLALLLCGAGYCLFLITYYHGSIVERHGYTGLTEREVSVEYWMVAWAMSLLPLAWLPIRFSRPSDFTVWSLYIPFIAPAPFVGLLISSRSPIEVLTFQAVVTLSFGLLELRRGGGGSRLHAARAAHTLARYGVPAITVLFALYVLSRNGFRFNLSFTDVYTRRFAARELVLDGSLGAYANALMARVLVPITIAIGLYYRQRLHLIAGVVAAAATFSVDGTKNSALQPVLLTLVVLLASRRKWRHGLVMLLGALALIILAFVEDLTAGTYVLNDFAVRRILVVPSQLTIYHWEYFADQPLVLMRDGILGTLLGERYDSPSILIGYEYFHSDEQNATAGIWANAFAHFGFWGIPATALLCAWILRTIDRLALSRSFVTGCAICFSVGTVWAEKAFHTAMITGGVAGLALLLLALPNLDETFRSAGGWLLPSGDVGTRRAGRRVPSWPSSAGTIPS